jgi:hypothetical protein
MCFKTLFIGKTDAVFGYAKVMEPIVVELEGLKHQLRDKTKVAANPPCALLDSKSSPLCIKAMSLTIDKPNPTPSPG